MVEQMVSSNLSKYGLLGKCPSIITTNSDVQNDNKTTISSSFVQEDQSKSLHPPGTSSSSSSNVNRNLVYARRKSDAELSNSRTTTSSSDKSKTTTATYQQAAAAAGDQKPFALNSNRITIEQSMEHWNARFSQLHNYLHQCDTTSYQEERYLQKLRSFSPDDCNRHAVELERRAIQLTMQEGTEIKRVKDLNVLGKSAGNHLLLQFGH